MNYKSLIYEEFGKPDEVIKVVERVYPAILPDETIVQMLMVPINPSDLIPATGAYAHRIKLPAVVGYEGVGRVKEVGSPLYEHLLGKLVLPLKNEGTWQELVVAKTADLIEVPDFLSIEDAACAYINPITAWNLCTKELNLGQNDFLLVNACNSAIGRLLIQLAKALNFKIIAVVRNENYKKELLELGADFVVSTDERNLIEEVMQITNQTGVAAAIDSIGGQAGTDLAKCVRENGDFLTIGLMSGVQVDWQLIFELPISARIFHLRHWADSVSSVEWRNTFERVFELVRQGKLKFSDRRRVYSFDEYRQAVADALSDEVKEKVFLKINH